LQTPTLTYLALLAAVALMGILVAATALNLAISLVR
jgi:hypothetical protein